MGPGIRYISSQCNWIIIHYLVCYKSITNQQLIPGPIYIMLPIYNAPHFRAIIKCSKHDFLCFYPIKHVESSPTSSDFNSSVQSIVYTSHYRFPTSCVYHLDPSNLATYHCNISMYIYIQRYTGWWFGTCFIFHNIWDVILPIDFHMFQDC